ncbi:MAG: hypothetical protein K2M34_04820 [Alphaproteobacteria bacterium]|nr:hypothetical protein [Alphaproteobacteria bacterium]
MIKFLFGIFVAVLPILSAGAYNDCLNYKITPRIDIATYEWEKSVSQPDDYMNEHGHVQTSLIQENGINVKLFSVIGGWCVVLDSVDTKIGYKKFDVKVDKKYKPNSCFYNAVLAHEDKHINVHLSVLENHKKALHDTLYGAANSIMPIFIEDIETVDNVINDIGHQLNKHPDVVLILQKMNSDLDIQNSKVDLDESGADMKKCLDEVLDKKKTQ